MSESAPSPAVQGLLVSAMWTYAATVLYPAQALRRFARAATPAQDGETGETKRPGLGVRFSRMYATPLLASEPNRDGHDHLVREFDRMAEVYAEFVRPFSRPIFDEALTVLARYLPADARVLDAGCGPGTELRKVARLVPDGEVVGIDLAAGMVEAAFRAAHAAGLDNVAFIQADVGALPADFTGEFDLVYSCLAHHHYPDPAAATREIFRALRPGGAYCIVDPGPRWYTAISSPIARLADPGWIGFHTPAQFARLLEAAGFEHTAWHDILPGFGVAVALKPAA